MPKTGGNVSVRNLSRITLPEYLATCEKIWHRGTILEVVSAIQGCGVWFMRSELPGNPTFQRVGRSILAVVLDSIQSTSTGEGGTFFSWSYLRHL